MICLSDSAVQFITNHEKSYEFRSPSLALSDTVLMDECHPLYRLHTFPCLDYVPRWLFAKSVQKRSTMSMHRRSAYRRASHYCTTGPIRSRRRFIFSCLVTLHEVLRKPLPVIERNRGSLGFVDCCWFLIAFEWVSSAIKSYHASWAPISYLKRLPNLSRLVLWRFGRSHLSKVWLLFSPTAPIRTIPFSYIWTGRNHTTSPFWRLETASKPV